MTLSSNPRPRLLRRVQLWLGKRLGSKTAGLLAGASTLLGTTVGFDLVLLVPTGITMGAAAFIYRSHGQWRRAEELQNAADRDAASAQLEESVTNDFIKLGAEHARFTNLFTEITQAVADMADKTKTGRDADFILCVKQTVLAIVNGMHREIDGVRAVVYQIVPDKQRMEVVDWTAKGWRTAPSEFVRGTNRGDKAFEVLVQGRPLYVEDISKAPDEWAGSGSGYKTFISVPIMSRENAYGLLTVDAPDAGSLRKDDENDLILVAGILAIIFAEKQRRVPGRTAGGS
ncbi:GAF domain-containing protein [Clavibacter michiganensis]|uniref:GAF domain-containing protein n=1 Tax=Clavibacter michiganensis TaxID=28447 RepID=UPI003079A2DF